MEKVGDYGGLSFLDSDELDRAGFDLGATGRLQLMAKLAEGKIWGFSFAINVWLILFSPILLNCLLLINLFNFSC